MLFVVKRLALGLFLIALAIGVLLLSDWNRRSESRQAIPRIAILQHASQPVLEEGVQGMLLGLAEGGYKDGETVAIQRFNAENDTPTENAIAREITDGRYDLILTASTLSLQAVAGANRTGRTTHVFGLVTDPFSAGVGISREDPLNHPKHLVGYGSMQPVGGAFDVAKQLLPSLTTVGVVWNPAESNSQASTRKAREVSVQLGIRLLEATVDNSSGVVEAAGSLISRGVQALWVGGDVTVLVALDGIISAAQKARIPVFTNIPPSTQRGALFDFGADHEEIGRLTGELAANLLHGADPAAIPVKNVVPKMFIVNPGAFAGLREPWRLPDDVRRQADAVVEGGALKKATRTMRAPTAGRIYKVGVDSGMQGLKNHITGVGSFPPVPDTVQLIRDVVPGVRKVGTICNNSEANSRKVIAVARDEFRKHGITLEEVPITNTSEVFQAAQVLTTRHIQGFWITGDNTVLQAFEGVVKVARKEASL